MPRQRDTADLHACIGCASLVDFRWTTCPVCGHWLGRGPMAIWTSCVLVGSLLITVAFFLPWIEPAESSQRAMLTGYDLARIARQATPGATGRPIAASIALYLAPITGLLILVLLGAVRPLNLRWRLVGRLVVGLAAIPSQIALLVTLAAVGVLGNNNDLAWPQIGLITTSVGCLLIMAGGIELGGPGLPLKLRRDQPLPVRSRSDRFG